MPPAKYSPLPSVAAFVFSALRLRLRFGSPCGGRRRAAGSSSGRHHARAAELFLPSPSASSGRLVPHRLGSCLVISTRRLLPGEGVGSACLRLRRFRRGGVPCRDLPRSPPPSAVTHAPGNEVSADPAAASRCSLCSRLSLSASGSPRRFRRERGSRSALLICRRQPSRLRSLPVADHASLLPIAGQGKKEAATASLLCLRSLPTNRRSLSPPSPPTHPITSRYVEVVRCAATARASPARQGFT